MDKLQDAGIFPYGSEQLSTYQKHLIRYLSREFKRLEARQGAVAISNRGPMWGQTGELMEHHYDEDDRLFSTFLDQRHKAYSMAYYGDTAEEVKASPLSLEEAQTLKFKIISERAGIRGDEKILNIGCGFGSLESYLYSIYPKLEITSVTPSTVQADYIKEKKSECAHPFHGKRFTLINDDFANIQPETLGLESFDLILSIGVLEHVNNLYTLFSRLYQLLKPGGKTFHHLITSRIIIPNFLDSDNTLIGKYFPGGKVWPFATLEAQHDFFQLEQSWFINGMNYYRTLDQWHQRFWENIEQLYPSVLSEEAIKHWNDYFVLCKACFAPEDGAVYGNGHFLYRKN